MKERERERDKKSQKNTMTTRILLPHTRPDQCLDRVGMYVYTGRAGTWIPRYYGSKEHTGSMMDT